MLCEDAQSTANVTDPTEINSQSTEGYYLYGNSSIHDFATGYFGNRGQFSTEFITPTGRHSDGSNYLLADGHVKWLRGNQISSGYTANNETDPQQPNSMPFPTAAGSGDSTGGYVATFSVN